jgi:hypothetical protein
MSARQLEDGYWRAYRDFYRWSAIWRGAATKPIVRDRLRHLAYAGGWKKFEPLWDMLIRSRQVTRALPLLESLLASFGGRPSTRTGSPAQRVREADPSTGDGARAASDLLSEVLPSHLSYEERELASPLSRRHEELAWLAPLVRSVEAEA